MTYAQGYSLQPWLQQQRKQPKYHHYCSVAKSCPTLLWPHGLQPARLLCPWDFPGKNSGVGCHFLLHGIFLTKESNLDLLHCRRILYWMSHQGSNIGSDLHVYYPFHLIYLLGFIIFFSKFSFHGNKGFFLYMFHWFQFSSVAQSCLILCNSTDCSTPGFPVHH